MKHERCREIGIFSLSGADLRAFYSRTRYYSLSLARALTCMRIRKRESELLLFREMKSRFRALNATRTIYPALCVCTYASAIKPNCHDYLALVTCTARIMFSMKKENKITRARESGSYLHRSIENNTMAIIYRYKLIISNRINKFRFQATTRPSSSQGSCIQPMKIYSW